MTTDIIHIVDNFDLAGLSASAGNEIDQAIRAWLRQKRGASDSLKTERAYHDTMQRFRAGLHQAGLDLDTDPVKVALAAQAFASAGGVKASTYNQRLAVISSFYQYSMKMGLLPRITANPIERVDRRGVDAYAGAELLTPEDIKNRLTALDRSSLAGARDYNLLMVALTTGRRVAEVAGLRLGDLKRVAGGKVELHFRRCKGGKEMRDQLAGALSESLLSYLKLVYPAGSTDRAGAVWISLARDSYGKPLSDRSLQNISVNRLGIHFHGLRHIFAHEMETNGAKVSEIQARLGHKDLKTTGIYLQALRKSENQHADDLAALFGA